MSNNSNNSSAKKNAPNLDDDGAAKSTSNPDAKQLREFNEWFGRWINYQGSLAQYWRNRTLYEQQLTKQHVNVMEEQEGGSIKGKWDLRFQELCEYRVSFLSGLCSSGFI
jgi:hypothetical protein